MNEIDRRHFIIGTAAFTLAGKAEAKDTGMYGLIGRMTAKAGHRDALIALILEGSDAMPGCISYIVAKDPDNEHDIWITEVWDSSASHAAALDLPAVKASIATALPLIDRDANGFTQKTVPVGGTGLCNLANR